MPIQDAKSAVVKYIALQSATICFLLLSATLLAQEPVKPYSIPGSQVIRIQDSKTNKNFQLFIKLPPAHRMTELNEKKLPVIYITDANYNFPMVEGFMRVATYDNDIKDSILVGISHEEETSSNVSRVYYYTPIVDAEWKNKTGGADEHLRFIKTDVIQYIESHFPADPSQRTYIGYSLGGLLGAYSLLTQPELFANYVLISPSLWYDDGYIFSLAATENIDTPVKPVKVFVSAGEYESTDYDGRPNDLIGDARKFTNIVQSWHSPNIEIRFHQVDDADHAIAFPEPMVKALYWMHKGPR